MSENLEDNEPRIIPPAVGNTQNEHVEPLIGTEHAPRVARSVSSDPEESALPSSGAATPVRPAPRRSAPRARRMSLSLTRVDAWSVAKVTFMLSIAVAIIQVGDFPLDCLYGFGLVDTVDMQIDDNARFQVQNIR